MTRPIKHYGAWRIRWTDAEGVRRSETHAARKDAELALRRHEVEAAEIRRGLRKQRPEDRCVGDACDYWLEHRAPHKKSGADDACIIRRHLRPALGTVRLADLGSSHIDRYLAERGHLQPRTRCNHMALLSAIINVAVELGWLATRPRIRKPQVRTFDRDFRYLKTADEINRFLTAARAEGDPVFLLYATAVYTGMRAGELAGLRWEDVNFERRLITVHRSYNTTTKANDVRYVPILPPILRHLEAWRLRSCIDLVFPNARGRMLTSTSRVFQETLHRVLQAADFPSVAATRTGRYITFHSLRHTLASHWVMGGGDLYKLQKILGHKTVQMTMRYAHLVPDAFAADHDRLPAVAAFEESRGVVRIPAHA